MKTQIVEQNGITQLSLAGDCVAVFSENMGARECIAIGPRFDESKLNALAAREPKSAYVFYAWHGTFSVSNPCVVKAMLEMQD